MFQNVGKNLIAIMVTPKNEKRNGNGKNEEYLLKLFDMVEKFADRLIKLERKMNE